MIYSVHIRVFMLNRLKNIFEADGGRFKLYIELEKELVSKLLFGCEQSLCCCIFTPLIGYN